ncbi:MAG: Peroxisome chaperone and import receptor [Pleopsidium flavum]|nr:MAG: Peroxisome chaperone and import receptor [Pleopsidium flavum]
MVADKSPTISVRAGRTEPPRLLHPRSFFCWKARNNVKIITFSVRKAGRMEKEQSQHQDKSPGNQLAAAEPLSEENAPDPDEDDLDDLDDLLDEFSATKIDAKEDAPPHSGPGRPQAAVVPPAATGDLQGEDEFAKQLQAGMANLLGELETSPEMQQQFESLVKELGDAAGMAPPHAEASSTASTVHKSEAGSSTGAEESFQETIRKTMERMQNSGEQATAAAASENPDDLLAQMMKEMQGGGLDGAGSEEDFSKMLMGVMEQLTNKDILYEPMQELHNKFPAWMSKNRESTAKDDLQRYEEQQRLVGEIVGKFEEKGYSDSNAADREFIVERMQKVGDPSRPALGDFAEKPQMQAAGSPPADLVGDMNAAQEALGDLDSGCPQQ